jgi:hypothetical protein
VHPRPHPRAGRSPPLAYPLELCEWTHNVMLTTTFNAAAALGHQGATAVRRRVRARQPAHRAHRAARRLRRPVIDPLAYVPLLACAR